MIIKNKKGSALLLLLLVVTVSCRSTHDEQILRKSSLINEQKNGAQDDVAAESFAPSSSSYTPNKQLNLEIWHRIKRNISTRKSVVEDWQLICEELCGASLGGPICGPRCAYLQVKPDNQSITADLLLGESGKNSICFDLCSNQLGGIACKCRNPPFVSQVIAPIINKEKVCETFCINNGMTITGCATCTKLPGDERDVDMQTPQVTTPSTTTTPNWNEICVNLCKTGHGGALCNCDLPPFLV